MTYSFFNRVLHIYSKSARNFNAAMCAAAKTTIVEVEEIVETGCIDPDHVHVPGIYVNRIVLGKDYVKKIEVNCKLSVIVFNT